MVELRTEVLYFFHWKYTSVFESAKSDQIERLI